MVGKGCLRRGVRCKRRSCQVPAPACNLPVFGRITYRADGAPPRKRSRLLIREPETALVQGRRQTCAGTNPIQLLCTIAVGAI